MGFQDLQIESEYRSRHADVINDFYIPLFVKSKIYCRAVGFFSSGVLARYAVGISKLIKNGGMIRMVASPKLSDEDLEAIKKGYEYRKKMISNILLQDLKEPIDIYEKISLNLLANYIAEGKLDFKIALMKDNNSIGIYHEKLGLLYDFENNVVAFSGSSNESVSSVDYNYETIDVYRSWINGEQGRVQNKIKAFHDIWENNDTEIEVMDFPEVKEEILQRYKYTTDKLDAYDVKKKKELQPELSIEDIVSRLKNDKVIGIPDTINLRDYQLRAIESWKNAGCRGIFDMATGTGKTYTAIAAVCNLYEHLQGRLFVIFVCPYQHLVEQWIEDLRVFGIKTIVAYSSPKYKDYAQRLERAVFGYELRSINFVSLITTVDTFSNERIQSQLEKVKDNILLVVDEAHNIGAQSYRKLLSFRYQYRLALSATFERFRDDEGTEILYDFFGDKCIEYSLEQAINDGMLTRYKYYPIPVYLSDDELDIYNHLSAEISKNLTQDRDGQSKLNTKGKKLAVKRARIAAGAVNKIQTLKNIIKDYKDDNHILVYCGAAKVHDKHTIDDSDEIRQIDRITRMLGKELGMKVAQFTSRENAAERMNLQEEFAAGDELQALVAIKCLDEGVNIPAIKMAFILASTTNPKEYIQRRGRVLRLFPGKKYATIYDFVTLPHDLDIVPFLSEEQLKYDRSLVKNELNRINEFQRLADNSFDSIDLMFNIRDVYDLKEEEEKYDGE